MVVFDCLVVVKSTVPRGPLNHASISLKDDRISRIDHTGRSALGLWHSKDNNNQLTVRTDQYHVKSHPKSSSTAKSLRRTSIERDSRQWPVSKWGTAFNSVKLTN